MTTGRQRPPVRFSWVLLPWIIPPFDWLRFYLLRFLVLNMIVAEDVSTQFVARFSDIGPHICVGVFIKTPAISWNAAFWENRALPRG